MGYYENILNKVQAHLKTVERGGLAIQPVDITIDEETASDIANAGKVSLNDQQVEKLRSYLNCYAKSFQEDIALRSSQEINRWLESLSKKIDGLTAMLDQVDATVIPMNADFSVSDGLSIAAQKVFHDAKVGLSRYKRDAAALREALEKQRSSNSQSGPRRNFYLLPLMNSLASLYREAGGRSTGIQRGLHDSRKSPFVDFVWAAMLLLPEKMRHSSNKALVTWWDKNDPR